MKIKMAKLLAPILLLSLCFAGGCSKPKATMDKSLDNNNSSVINDTMVIPCLVYQEQGDKVVALIANWKIDSGTLDISKDQAFSFNKNDGTRFLVTWDGGNNFILTDSCVPSDQYRSSTKLIPLFGTGKPEIFLGENIRLTKIRKPSGDLDKYAVETEVNGKKISKDIRLDLKYQDKSGKSHDLNPNVLSPPFTYSDGKYAYFIFAGPVTSAIELISVKYNLVTDETSLSTIATDKQLDIGLPFGQDSVENIGGKFYFPTSDGIGTFDVYQNKFEYLKSLSDDCKNYYGAQLKFLPEDHPMYFSVGLYNDILLVSVPTDTYNEHLLCAVKDNKIIGAIYIQGQTMKLMDANKNVKSEMNLKELKLSSSCPLSFPRKNGTNMW